MEISADELSKVYKCEICKNIYSVNFRWKNLDGVDICASCFYDFADSMDIKFIHKMTKTKDVFRCSVCGEIHTNACTLNARNLGDGICLACLYEKLGQTGGIYDEGVPEKIRDVMSKALEETGYRREAELKYIGKSFDPEALGKEEIRKADITDFKKEEVYPVTVKRYLDRFVVGQEEAKKVLSVAAYNHYKRLQIKNSQIQKSNVMLVGPTGCGKTHLVKTLAKAFNVPVALCQATCLTESGYIGDDPSSVIERLYKLSDNDVERTQRGIVFIDEIDKLGGEAKKRDVGGKGVQQALLPIIEGTTISIGKGGANVLIDTSNILFIFGGAFAGIEPIIEERLSVSGVPFSGSNILKSLQNEDFIKFGMIPEFMGRIPVYAILDEMSTDALKKILCEPEDSIIKQYTELFKYDGVELIFEDAALNYIAEMALKEGTGARALRTILENILLEIQFTLPGLGMKKCVVTEACAKGVGDPIVT